MTTMTLYFDTTDRAWKLLVGNGKLAAGVKIRGVHDFASAKREARKILGYSPRWVVTTRADGTEVGKATSPKTDLVERAWSAA